MKIDELMSTQLNRYAEDFGALFAEYHDIKAQVEKTLMQNQRASEIQRSLEKLLQSMDDAGGIVVTDSAGMICELSLTAKTLLGCDPVAAIGQPLELWVAQTDRDPIRKLADSLEWLAGQPSAAIHVRPINDQEKILSLRVLRVPDPEQGYRLHWLLRTVAESTGETDRRAELFSQLYARSTNGIMVTDTQGVILSVNPAFSEITGYAEHEIVGKNPNQLSSGRQNKDFYHQMWQALMTRGEWQGEIWNRRKNGETYLEWLSILPVRDELERPIQYVAMFYDAGHYLNAQQRIYQLANHDSLTGLPNRSLFMDRLQQAIFHARRTDSSVGLLYVDLDRFSEVNDSLGHPTGDQLLIEFSWRLMHAVRDGDTAARLGGDEFVVIAPDLSCEQDIRIVADKIIRSLSDPIVINERELFVGASVGVAAYPTHGGGAEELLKNAGIAMHAAKASGGNVCHLFSDAIGQHRTSRFEMESGLRRALAQGQFRLAYQPQVTAADSRIVGVEALLRWNWPGHGNVPPDRFIPLAEEIGLIHSIGEWVLRAACQQTMAWRRDGMAPLRMSVNVAARQLNASNFVQSVIAILEETGMSPCDLEIEITESQLMDKNHTGLKNLAHLRTLGIAVAVDDFGTGYSSLGRIRSLPIDRIKVDKSFVDDVSSNADSFAIVNAILAMAKALNLEAIAEGIEQQDQAHLLAGINCQEFQGYLFGRPQEPEAIACMVQRQMGEQS